MKLLPEIIQLRFTNQTYNYQFILSLL